MFLKYLKKITIICFTKNPYKIKRFKDLYTTKIGVEIDLPESNSFQLTVSNGSIVHYPKPCIINPHKKMDRYIDEQLRFNYKGIFTTSKQCLYSLSNGCIIGQLGLAYDIKKRSFIDESSKEWITNLKDSPYVRAFNLSPKTFLKGITFSFLSLGADGGFYHFLFESLTKVALFKPLLKSADHYLFNGPATDWKLKWINKANIDVSKIIWANDDGHYQCEQLLFTNKLIYDQQLNNWCVVTLKNTFSLNDNEEPLTSSEKIIWITRRGSGSRNIIWEEHIFKQFKNIESVDLTTLNADETIAKLKNATHIIAPHGAGLSNIYLAKPRTKVLELFEKDTFFQPCYYRLSHICGLDHKVLFVNFKDKNDVDFGINFFGKIFKAFTC
ncbi:hypothetical protein ABIB40_003594 [Pedobacter sp. UYP30]|uniref:glycosyltransferase family 61 protein n=1 Tax=Pedobacter sp. UYP30 TaxID=1756400 RepID=UPI00339517B3